MLKQASERSEKLKIPVWLWMTLDDHLSLAFILLAILATMTPSQH